MKVGGDDDGSLLIIMACMAKYCSYWRRMKSPIDGNIIADVSRRVGCLGEEWKTLWMGGSSIPPLHPTQQSTIIESGWKYVMNNEEACEFGLQLGLDDDGNIIGSTELVLGEGGSEDIMEWWE